VGNFNGFLKRFPPPRGCTPTSPTFFLLQMALLAIIRGKMLVRIKLGWRTSFEKLPQNMLARGNQTGNKFSWSRRKQPKTTQQENYWRKQRRDESHFGSANI